MCAVDEPDWVKVFCWILFVVKVFLLNSEKNYKFICIYSAIMSEEDKDIDIESDVSSVNAFEGLPNHSIPSLLFIEILFLFRKFLLKFVITKHKMKPFRRTFG